MGLEITWNCNLDMGLQNCHPKYSAKRYVYVCTKMLKYILYSGRLIFVCILIILTAQNSDVDERIAVEYIFL